MNFSFLKIHDDSVYRFCEWSFLFCCVLTSHTAPEADCPGSSGPRQEITFTKPGKVSLVVPCILIPSDLIIFGGGHERGPSRLRLGVDELRGAPLVGDLGQAHVRHVDLAALHDEHEHVGAAVVRPRGVPAVVQHELERHRIVFNRSVEQEGEISLKIMGAILL